MRAEVWDDQSLFIPKTLEALKMADIAKMSADELLLLTDAESIEDGIEQIKQWPAKIKISYAWPRKAQILLTEQSEFRIEGYDVPCC